MKAQVAIYSVSEDPSLSPLLHRVLPRKAQIQHQVRPFPKLCFHQPVIYSLTLPFFYHTQALLSLSAAPPPQVQAFPQHQAHQALLILQILFILAPIENAVR